MNFVFGALLFVSSLKIFAAEIEVLTATATSYDPKAVGIECLLQPNCKGFWSPESKDSGIDEGIYIQLKDNVDVDFIEVDFEKNVDSPSLVLYLNGKTTSETEVVFNSYHLIVGQDSSLSTVLFGGSALSSDEAIRPLNTKMKSFFLKIDGPTADRKKPKLKAIRFYAHNESLIPQESAQKNGSKFLPGFGESFKGKIIFKLPIKRNASVSATSILEPETAYHPANLFDSKYDSAWSSNGKKNTGVGESFDIKFEKKINLSGMLIWNGYQRSDNHFTQNGAVSRFIVTSNGTFTESLELKPAQGAQKILFKNPLNDVRSLHFKIEEIKKGTKYRDVLISEIRFIDDKGNLVLPNIVPPNVKIGKDWELLLDRSWSTFLHAVGADWDSIDSLQESLEIGDWSFNSCYNQRVRLRSNGTFVIYSDFDYGLSVKGKVEAVVMEGNWEPKDMGIRIFGKKYSSSLKSSEYVDAEKKAANSAKIFQSLLNAHPFEKLSFKEQEKFVVNFLQSRMKIEHKRDGIIHIATTLKAPKDGLLYGKNFSDLVNKILIKLRKLKPLVITSSVISSIFISAEEVGACSSGHY